MKYFLTTFFAAFLITAGAQGQDNSASKITPDDYPVTNNMFKEKAIITFLDEAWFVNDTLQQTLIFKLYTDYHRINIYHFYNKEIPEEMVKRMSLNYDTGQFKNMPDPATTKQKEAFIRESLTTNKKISRSYFITNKGIKLGDKKEKVYCIYGKPNSNSIYNGIGTYEWSFQGDNIESVKRETKNKLLAKDSFGFDVTMFFKGNKLIGMIMSNDIP